MFPSICRGYKLDEYQRGWSQTVLSTQHTIVSKARSQQTGTCTDLNGSRPVCAVEDISAWEQVPHTSPGQQECAFMVSGLFCLPCVCTVSCGWPSDALFLGRSCSGFHTSHWTSCGSLGFSSVWSLCQQPTIFFSLLYFLILAKIWLAPHSKK